MRSWPRPSGDLYDWAQALVRELEHFDATQQILPIGTVQEFYGSAPQGWLQANGTTFDEDSYPELAIRLGSTTLPTYTTTRSGCIVCIKAA